ncbi:MAG: ATP-binding protein [Ignavibacteria bacterium]|nr:ATP-binding protein [Ignavibacteria bacterium]
MITEELFSFNPWWEKEYSPDLIPREKFLEILRKKLNQKSITFLTGLRRVGKTSLMKLLIKELQYKINPKNIFYVSLDSVLLEKLNTIDLVREFRKINELKRNEKIYLFFDEVSYRNNIHLELKNLYDNENVKIFASSSSTSVLRDKRGLLTGRASVVEIDPLDFKEFLQFKKLEFQKSELYLAEKFFEKYLKFGGIPEYVLTEEIEYIDNLIDSIIYKDIAFYRGVKDVETLKTFFRILMERTGKNFSLSKISKVLGISSETVKRYFDYFTETFLIYPVERCGKLNERIRTPKKIYAADIGIRNSITGLRDIGSIFENIVYFEIKDKKPCYVLENGIEIDFKFNNTLLEVKYNSDLNEKQKLLFDKIRASEKIIIRNIEDYLRFIRLI